jgi:hypothetical protein
MKHFITTLKCSNELKKQLVKESFKLFNLDLERQLLGLLEKPMQPITKSYNEQVQVVFHLSHELLEEHIKNTMEGV